MAKTECYVAKFRLSDGAVVDVWKGPAAVPEFNVNGPVYEGEKRGLGFYAKKALFMKAKPTPLPKMVHPTLMLATKGQGAVEISFAEYEAMGTLTEPNGRLRWKIVGLKLVPNEGPLFTSDGPITDAPAVNKGVLDVSKIGELSLGGSKRG